jgi:hypothetical protein
VKLGDVTCHDGPTPKSLRPIEPDSNGHCWKPVTMWLGMGIGGPVGPTLLSTCTRCKATKESKRLTEQEQQCLKAEGIGSGMGMPPCGCLDGRDALPCSGPRKEKL